MVFYLKYRPRKISELDSLALQERLGSVLRGKLPDAVPHAFLFTGPKGLGKTSTARIVAKAINCTNRKGAELEPCNKCESCKSIDSGASLDVLEIDGASNRGIDEIRDLREKIRLSPVNSRKKVYIIDEVHMLTTEAFNALLKTLEEPPAHAQFFLCTTEPQKIPETISSRCFSVHFTRATDEDLIHSFKRILKGEEIKADEDALLQVAALSDGSFRDGAKIIEELSAGTKNITTKIIEKKYNFQSVNKSIVDLTDALKNRDAKKGIEIVSKLSQENTDFKLFTEQLINVLHKNLISEVENGSGQAKETRDLITMLVKSYASIKYAVLPQLPLELTIVEWCSQESVEEEVEQVSLASVSKPVKADESLEPEKATGKIATNQSALGDDKILSELIDSVKKDNFSIAGVLRGCSVKKFNKKELVLSTEFKFHKERLSDKKVLTMLEEKLQEITGEKTTIKIE
jgi:DNA polymerase-3 subunit gamma/tau